MNCPRWWPKLAAVGVLLALWICLLVDARAATSSEPATIVTITDQVLVEQALPVQRRFAGRVRDDSARAYHLTADDFAATNEWTHPTPQVALHRERIDGPASGYETVLAPFGMHGYLWEIE